MSSRLAIVPVLCVLLAAAVAAEESPSPAPAPDAAPAVASVPATGAAPAPAAPAPATAEVPPVDPAALTLDQVIARALVDNRALRDARSSLLQARLGRSIALTTVFSPTLSTSYTAYNGDGDNGTGTVALTGKALGFEIEPYLRMGYARQGRVAADGSTSGEYATAGGISISRRLFAIAEHVRQRLPLTQSDIAIYQAANNLVLAGRDLERRATGAFLGVQRAQTRLAVRERRLRDAQEFLATVRDRIAHGFSSPLDGLNAEIDLNQAEADRIADRTSLASAGEQLNDLLDRPLRTPVALRAEVIDAARVAGIPVRDLEADLGTVLADHEQLGNAAREAELLGLRLRIQRDALRPDVTAALTAEREADGPRTFDGRDGLGNTVALTVTWTMPLDGWRAERAQYEQLNLQIADNDRRVAGLRNSLEAQLRDTWRSIEAQRRQLALAERRVEIERLRLDATLRRYEAGAVDNLEVTRSKQSLDSAEIALLDARIDLVLADAGYRALLPLTATPVAIEAPEAGNAPRAPAGGRGTK